MSKLGKRLIAATKEARAIARGEADPAAYNIYVPDQIDVKAMRREMHLSQEQFAHRFGLSPARIRDWEQGRSSPDGAVRAYLMVIKRERKAVESALGKQLERA